MPSQQEDVDVALDLAIGQHGSLPLLIIARGRRILSMNEGAEQVASTGAALPCIEAARSSLVDHLLQVGTELGEGCVNIA